MDIKIENTTGIFTISEFDAETNETYIGEFKVKVVLSPMDILSIDRDYRELIGSVSPLMASSDANNVAFALSQLRHRVIGYPMFWKGSGYDGGHLPKNVLYAILDASLEAQERFKDMRQKELEKIQKKLTKQVKENKIKKKLDEQEELSENE